MRSRIVLSFAAVPLILAFFAGAQTSPIGDLTLPDPSRAQSGVVIVQGWVHDQHTLSAVELWIDDAYRHALPLHQPFSGRRGFITGFLASRYSNGPHTVELRALAVDGSISFFGRRTITIDNSINQAPFGFTDSPAASGTSYAAGVLTVGGWAVDTDGIERIEVLVDDGVLQGALHGDTRPDVAASFPDLRSAGHSGFVANIDTTRLDNGVHTLQVRAIDKLGSSNLIGHRTIQVGNNDSFLKPFGFLDEPLRDATLYGTRCGEGSPVVSPPIRPSEHATLIRGWALDLGTRQDTGRVAYAELLVDGVRWLSTLTDCKVVEGRFTNCYGVPRPDVQRYYPTFPDAPHAGFLFTLDVGALLNLGVSPGSHSLVIRAGDREQTFAEIPNRDGIPVSFQCASDTHDFAAFGSIDYPGASDYVAGEVVLRGWAFDENEVAAIAMFIDGVPVGRAQYDYPRPDVAEQYPHIERALHSGWQFTLDTRKLANGQHRLTVYVDDVRENSVTIGSTDFYVFNASPQP